MAIEPESLVQATPPIKRQRRPGPVAGALGGGLVVLFAVLNSQSVEMHWLFSSTRTPLIVVIAVFTMFGFLGGYLAARHRRR